jgi:asparagine synthase (glutamine-hydrolysing)
MCGIAGLARSDGATVERATLDRMCRMLEHRGPDSRGFHLEGEIGLGIQRLRVIDLATGDQPIYNEDRTVAVVLNGEIYNYRELRERLERRGHRFATQSDTEAIVHLYEDLGPDCVEELHGMFAFAVWDVRRRRLLLARDRLGKKPLFYHHRDGALTFASELRSLLQDPEVPREIDPQALDCYLTYHYIPAPLSAFRGVCKLPPASRLVYERGELAIDRYWRLRYDGGDPPRDPREVHEQLRERIKAAVRRRMIADVPLGVFLSGGIDSATVVAAMAEASSEPVKTFSIGFEEEEFSELPNARLVAQRFSTDHHELITKPDAISLIGKIARHHGEPFGDSSAVPSFQIAELTRRQVTVALNGDGGDENFAGYDRYVTADRTRRIARFLPGPLARAIGAAGARTEERGDPTRPANRARRLARAIGVDECHRYRNEVSTFDDRERAELYSDEFAELIGESVAPDMIERRCREASGESLVNVLLEVDVNMYLPDDLLPKVDIATMASSLEARSPFLDHELMEFTASLPGSMKLRGSEKKVVLRDALRGWIPDEILDGPKRGFALPMVGEWFRGDLRNHIVEVLTDPSAVSRGYFRESYLRSILDRHIAAERDYSLELWALMMLEVWHQEFIDRPRSALEDNAQAAI